MMQELTKNRTSRYARSLMAGAFLACLAAPAAFAQGVDSKASVDAIVGSEIQEEQARSAVDADKVIAAIDSTADAIAFVRKASKLDKVEIVFLTDATTEEGGLPAQIQKKVDEKQPEIVELRKELEGNAMLFHAIHSRRILPQEIVAVAFDADHSATIYTTAKPAG